MPSIRKRIGYLPSVNAQESIVQIANKEKLSQSKVVGILVEEALMARGGHHLQNNDIDELISDRGITYNTKKYKFNPKNKLYEFNESSNEKLFKEFQQFILFKKMMQDN